MSETVYFKTKRTGGVNAVIVGSVTHKRILEEPENYERVTGPEETSKKPREPERSG